MTWEITSRGFLPTVDPAIEFTTPDVEISKKLDSLAEDLPKQVESGKIRESLTESLKDILYDVADPVRFYNDCTDAEIERLMMLYSYFASAYIHTPNLLSTKTLPAEIAVPLVMVSRFLGRPPILSYASYCLSNWKRTNPDEGIHLGNIELLQNFVIGNKEDEDWFILVHVDIEAKAGVAIEAINSTDAPQVRGERLLNSLVEMNKTLNRMPEKCSPDFYFNKVRPYIFGFKDVIYESCFPGNTPKSFRGETGAQSSIIPAVQTFLGIKHKQSILTSHLDEMREYMPVEHQNYLTELENRETLRDLASKDKNLKEIYNECLDSFIAFRKKHLQYAIDYIQKKVSNPEGTGGTPFIPWLSELVEESEGYRL